MIVAAEPFGTDKSLSPIQNRTMSNEEAEKPKLVTKMVDVVNRLSKKKLRDSFVTYFEQQQRVAMLESDFLQERRRRKRFNDMSMRSKKFLTKYEFSK